MDSFLSEVTGYFERYTDEFIRACKEVQQMTPPEWARSGSFWLQHEDGFGERLPLSLSWHDGMAGYDNERHDPVTKIVTEPWKYGNSAEWPPEILHPSWEAEEAMRLTICHWVRACWIRSGGRGHRMRFYVTDQASSEDYCLERGRLITQAELDRDLEA